MTHSHRCEKTPPKSLGDTHLQPARGVLLRRSSQKGDQVPISALLITLADDPIAADASLAALAENACFELGDRDQRRVAAALDTPDEGSNKRCWRWLNDQAGVYSVDLLFVHIDPQGVISDRSGSN